MDGRGRLAALFWRSDEGRLRAPWRLVVAGLGFLLLGEVVLTVAVRLFRLGTTLGPLLRATWAVVVAVVALAGAVGGVLALVYLVDRRRLADLGLARSSEWLCEFAVGLAVGVAMATGVVVAAFWLGVASVEGILASWTGTLSMTSYHLAFDAAFWLVVFLGVGVVEEVLIRGYVLVNVAEGLRAYVGGARRSIVLGVAASAGLFGLLHVGNPGGTPLAIANVLAFGLLLGATVALTGQLALAIGVHVAWNAALGLAFGLPVSGLETGAALIDVTLEGSRLVTGGDFGPEGGLLALAGLAAAVVGLGWWLWRRPGGPSIDRGLAEPDLRGCERTEE